MAGLLICLGEFQHKYVQTSTGTTGEVDWNGLHLVIAHDPATALEQHQKRRAQMTQLQAQANGGAGKLDEQDHDQQ